MTGQEIEVVSHDVTPAAAEPYRPQLMMSPSDAKALAEGLRENTRAILVAGDDYGVIPGTGSRPTLLKPGAEKLLQWFGLGHRMELVDLERDDKGTKCGVTYRCVVTKAMGPHEVVVATCDAYAGRDESKWAKAPWNTIIKMAEKRALVGAALQATGSSSLFTQDIEPNEAPDPFMVLATATIKRQEPDVKAGLREWMADEGIPTSGWTPEVAVSLLIAVGELRVRLDAGCMTRPKPAAPPAADGEGSGAAPPLAPPSPSSDTPTLEGVGT